MARRVRDVIEHLEANPGLYDVLYLGVAYIATVRGGHFRPAFAAPKPILIVNETVAEALAPLFPVIHPPRPRGLRPTANNGAEEAGAAPPRYPRVRRRRLAPDSVHRAPRRAHRLVVGAPSAPRLRAPPVPIELVLIELALIGGGDAQVPDDYYSVSTRAGLRGTTLEDAMRVTELLGESSLAIAARFGLSGWQVRPLGSETALSVGNQGSITPY
jgi:hypothetical protein